MTKGRVGSVFDPINDGPFAYLQFFSVICGRFGFTASVDRCMNKVVEIMYLSSFFEVF